DGTAELVAYVVKRQESAERAGGDEIVPAGVPEIGKSVVLRENGDLGMAAGSHPSTKGRRESGQPGLKRDTLEARCFGEPSRGAMLGESKLRIFVKLTGDLDEARAVDVYLRVETPPFDGHRRQYI